MWPVVLLSGQVNLFGTGLVDKDKFGKNIFKKNEKINISKTFIAFDNYKMYQTEKIELWGKYRDTYCIVRGTYRFSPM